jgi:hypothetical protein
MSLKENNEDFIQQEISTTIKVPNALLGASFTATFKPDYQLPLAEFKDLKGSTRSIDNLLTNAFWLTIGLGVNCGGKYLAIKFEYQAKIETFEYFIFGIAVLITIVLFAISKCTPDERKMTLAKIEKHFNDAPEQKIFFNGGDK